MKQGEKKRRARLIGIGLDSDGHLCITTGENFTLIGGSKDTHEEMTEKAIKINEKLAKKGKTLDQISRKEFEEIAESVGLKPFRPYQNRPPSDDN